MASQELSLAYMVLPPSILDWFDIVKVEEQITDTTGKEVFVGMIHIYLDESDNRTSDTAHLRPNGFTEETKVSDFPIRDRKVLLHIRRRRWLDSEGKNVIISTYPLVEQGTRYSPEFAAFLKRQLDTTPITASQLSRHWGVDGRNLERAYKDWLSDFHEWEQLDHAEEWMLLPDNIGISMSIDETSLNGELYTILTNKAGHGKKGTIVAMIKGTKVCEIVRVLNKLPEEKRMMVCEISMDFSDSMRAAVKDAFPGAEIVVDCFHVVKRCGDAVEELRLKCKREAVKERKKEEAEHKKKLARRVAMRKAYRKRHPKIQGP